MPRAYLVYERLCGPDVPTFAVVASAEHEAQYLEITAQTMEKLGEDFERFFTENLGVISRIDTIERAYIPEASYVPEGTFGAAGIDPRVPNDPSVETWRRKIVIPARDPSAGANLVDLSSFYTAGLCGTWHPIPSVPEDIRRHALDLSELSPGIQTLAGTAFDIRGIVQLQGGKAADLGARYPKQVCGIPVKQRCRALHFLHACGWGHKEADRGQIIGEYVVHYGDGQPQRRPIRLGWDVVDWCKFPGGPSWEDPRVVAWRGTCPLMREEARRGYEGLSIRLFKTTWKNPSPDKSVESLDYVSAMREPAPFLIAITAE